MSRSVRGGVGSKLGQAVVLGLVLWATGSNQAHAQRRVVGFGMPGVVPPSARPSPLPDPGPTILPPAYSWRLAPVYRPMTAFPAFGLPPYGAGYNPLVNPWYGRGYNPFVGPGVSGLGAVGLNPSWLSYGGYGNANPYLYYSNPYLTSNLLNLYLGGGYGTPGQFGD